MRARLADGYVHHTALGDWTFAAPDRPRAGGVPARAAHLPRRAHRAGRRHGRRLLALERHANGRRQRGRRSRRLHCRIAGRPHLRGLGRDLPEHLSVLRDEVPACRPATASLAATSERWQAAASRSTQNRQIGPPCPARRESRPRRSRCRHSAAQAAANAAESCERSRFPMPIDWSTAYCACRIARARRQVEPVPVGDAELIQPLLQARAVGERVLGRPGRPAGGADRRTRHALAHQRGEERLGVPAVGSDGQHLSHARQSRARRRRRRAAPAGACARGSTRARRARRAGGSAAACARARRRRRGGRGSCSRARAPRPAARRRRRRPRGRSRGR